MIQTAEHPFRDLILQAKADLAPFDGRFAMAWRGAAVCALMALAAMMFQIWESAISCYLLLFLMKPDAIGNIVVAIAVMVLVLVIVGPLVLLVNLTIDVPPLRILVMMLSSFVFLYLGSATKLGEGGGIVALIIAFIMTLLSDVPVSEVATRGLLYACLMAVVPMLVLLGFNLFLGRAPQKLLRAQLARRLNAAADALRQADGASRDAVGQLLLEGQADAQQRATMVRLFRYVSGAEGDWLNAAVTGTYRLLLAVAALPATARAEVRLELAAHCDEAARAIAAGRRAAVPHFALDDEADAAVAEARAALIALATPGDQRDVGAPKASFLADEGFLSPIHQRFALKTTAAALICYLVYTALDWQGIHTALITCYVAALGTTGETVHKLVLRIGGCLVGAAMGIFAILFVIPQLDGIGGFVVMIFVAILPAAWISSGSPRISYAGVQVGLAFLLTVLQGFGPSTDMDAATDRILGILLGNLVVYLIFTRVWPVGAAGAVRASIGRALSSLARLAALPPADRIAAVREANSAAEASAAALEELRLVQFEPAALRPPPAERARLQETLAEIRALTPWLFLHGNASAAESARLQGIAERMKTAPSAPASQDAASERQHPSAERTIDQRLDRLERLVGA
ncbi:FUSC family protein [Variovorax sp. J22P168]|uniref:FUSC family protein n=1 Tax=Variovorax jilinensis TaxID=3053513 RepID=UPI00257796D3|nr:FUSC family protein [Variovorax sp. J22P168]MDM0014929.1 FUSC family protein [Variovorax sp. J22P168]